MVCKNDEELYVNSCHKYKIQISYLSPGLSGYIICQNKNVQMPFLSPPCPNQVHDMHDHSLILTQFIELARESIKKEHSVIN